MKANVFERQAFIFKTNITKCFIPLTKFNERLIRTAYKLTFVCNLLHLCNKLCF